MDKSPVIKAAEDLRDLVNTEVSDPRTRAMLLRYLEDFEDKYRGESERRLLPAIGLIATENCESLRALASCCAPEWPSPEGSA